MTVTLEVAASPPRTVHRFTIGQYERLVKVGILGPNDRAELIDGWLVDKMPHNPRHATVVDLTNQAIENLLPEKWTTRSQLPIRLPGDNAPEPDVVVVAAPKRRYFDRHPTDADVALVIEVSDTSLDEDRGAKLLQYAAARLPEYWIVDVKARRIEVHTLPRGGKKPGYRKQSLYGPNDSVPVVIAGKRLGLILVSEILP